MSNEEAIIRMAEKLGWSRVEKDEYWNRDWYSAGDWVKGSGEDIKFMFKCDFNPLENIEQAMEVLTALVNNEDEVVDYYYICNDIGGQFRCFLSIAYDNIVINQSCVYTNICDAIFQAVKAYLEGGD